jgi:hypothetical protein
MNSESDMKWSGKRQKMLALLCVCVCEGMKPPGLLYQTCLGPLNRAEREATKKRIKGESKRVNIGLI